MMINMDRLRLCSHPGTKHYQCKKQSLHINDIYERLINIGIHIVTVWEYLVHNNLVYSLLFTAAKLQIFPETTNDSGEKISGDPYGLTPTLGLGQSHCGICRL